jgi:2-O-A-mannosyl-D-glycerate-specific PTS system IIC component
MLGGLVAGYAVRFLRKAIPAKGTLAGFISFWVYPVLSTMIVGIAIFLLVGKPVAWINASLINFLGSMSGSNGALLGAILGIMVSFDLGGPVNKAAYTFCVGAMAEGIIMPYAAFASIKMVSGFAVTAATKGFKNLFTKEEREIGSSTWILVLAGITEGAIPFMMADPVRVIFSLCAGSAVTGAIIGSTGIGLDVPGAGIFSLFLLKNGVGGVANAAIWFFAAVIGAAVSTVLLVLLRKQKLSSQK